MDDFVQFAKEREAMLIDRIEKLEAENARLRRCLLPVTLAQAECVDEPIPDDAVVLHFMGSGASDQVTAGEIRAAFDTAPPSSRTTGETKMITPLQFARTLQQSFDWRTAGMSQIEAVTEACRTVGISTEWALIMQLTLEANSTLAEDWCERQINDALDRAATILLERDRSHGGYFR